MSQEVPGFKYELANDPDAQSANRLSRFRENPDYLVKEMTPEWISKNIAKKKRIETMPEFLERVAARGQAVQREFSEMTGVKAPDSQLLVGRNEQGHDVLYRVSKQIHGTELEDAIRNGEVPDEEVGKLIRSVFEYYKSKLASGEDFMWDVHWVAQFRYGRMTGESEDSIYLADTDPTYGEGSRSEDDPRTGYADIEHETANVLDMMQQLSEVKEYSFLPQLRSEVRSFLSEHGIREN